MSKHTNTEKKTKRNFCEKIVGRVFKDMKRNLHGLSWCFFLHALHAFSRGRGHADLKKKCEQKVTKLCSKKSACPRAGAGAMQNLGGGGI
jgi:hypothetical protein